MTTPEPKKIAYLFGAGATNAELSNVGVDLTESGLLMGDVTRRVTLKAKEDPAFLERNRIFLERAADSANIELFISLVENNGDEIEKSLEVVDRLKQLVEADIKSVLTDERLEAFYLPKALLELHKLSGDEIILGLISLNYDTVLDEAYKSILGPPDYALSFPTENTANPPLLKLHGSFSWDEVELDGRKRKIPIIPLGINKNYLRLPYNFIWGRALEVLSACDILRVVGCSLPLCFLSITQILFE